MKPVFSFSTSANVSLSHGVRNMKMKMWYSPMQLIAVVKRSFLRKRRVKVASAFLFLSIIENFTGLEFFTLRIHSGGH